MDFAPFYPYRSAAARESYLAFYDSLAASEWPAASQTRIVPTSTGQTFVRITGPEDAPPLVLLPGACASSLMWSPNIELLSKRFRTYALDRAGDVGRTTCNRAVRCADDLLLWLNESLDGLGLYSGINLAGVSYGAWLTGYFACHYPKRINKAVMIACPLSVGIEFLIRAMFIGTGGAKRMHAFAAWLFRDLAQHDPDLLDEIVEQMSAALRSLQPGAIFRPPLLTNGQLAGLQVPTLFVVGEHEKVFAAAKAARRLSRVAPQIQVQIVPGAGHDVSIVQPQLLSSSIVDFVTAPEGV